MSTYNGAHQWVEESIRGGQSLTPFQRQAVDLLCNAMARGPYDFSRTFRMANWNYGTGVRFVIPGAGGVATFDARGLTTLVIGAHDLCIRVSIEPVNFNRLAVVMHPRKGRDGAMHNRHPTIEAAIDLHRAAFGHQTEETP